MNGYLHRIRLKPGLSLQELAKALPRNGYAEHQLVWRWFGGEGADRDFLFRREQQGHWPFFYVLSKREAEDPSGLWDIETRSFTPRLSDGEMLSFVLRANPVKVRKVSDDRTVKTRRRDDVVMDLKVRAYTDKTSRPPLQDIASQAGTAWLSERAAKCGFKIESVSVDGYGQQHWYKSDSPRPITVSILDFEGTLRVLDAGLFTKRLFQGIGPAKAFGCGLMLVRRV